MRRMIWIILSALLLSLTTAAWSQYHDELKIWQEFVILLKENKITEEHLRPPIPYTKESAFLGLDSFRKNAVWEEWEVEPEVIRFGNVVTFIVTLKQKGSGVADYSFNFILENDRWYFRHLEGIFIRLDKISSLPTSEFPDFPEGKKAYMRQEFY